MNATDEDYDDMHHALGRPRTARQETHRNYYSVGVDSATATRFHTLGWWNLRCTINGGRDGIFEVNHRGLDALEHWLKTPKGQETVRRMSR